MVDLLSLPRRRHLNVPEIKLSKTGVPINSLPGWERIPLNSKLPMLKCPDANVIFSKNKIGQLPKPYNKDFDNSFSEKIPGYDPLHDINLRSFYSRPQNLKRLRENGEITENNDVICTLKDFNDYRKELHKTQLYHEVIEFNRGILERFDRAVVDKAVMLAGEGNEMEMRRHNSITVIRGRREALALNRKLYFQSLLAKTEEKFGHIAAKAEMRQAEVEHKKAINSLKMWRHHEAAHDLQRKRLIAIKKNIQHKNLRKEYTLVKVREDREHKIHNTQTESWKRRLKERVEKEAKITKMMKEMNEQKIDYIQNYRSTNETGWKKIRIQIGRRAKKKYPKFRRKRGSVKDVPAPYETCEGLPLLETLLDRELCEAINKSLKVETVKLPFDGDDPIYKAAQFISDQIVNQYERDLSTDIKLTQSLSERIEWFFDEVIQFVSLRASQIISSSLDNLTGIDPCIRLATVCSECSVCSQNQQQQGRRVSFNRVSSTIGTSSYAIHPFINLKHVTNRQPTPAGSLADLMVQSKESLLSTNHGQYLCLEDLIFVEQQVIKFKRSLIIGVGKRVFGAINCHFQKKTIDVHKDLLRVDKNYMACQSAKAILGIVKRQLDYESALRFCVSVLSNEIISALQENILKFDRKKSTGDHTECCQKAKVSLCLFCDKIAHCPKSQSTITTCSTD